MTKTQVKSNEVLLQLIEKNQNEVGNFMRKLLEKDLEKWERHVVSLLARSKAYQNNNLPKLLELANDIKAVHNAQIHFTEKYIGDLFAPIAVKSLKMEQEETNFLDIHILPFLDQTVKNNVS